MKSYSTKKFIILTMFIALFFVLSFYGTINLGNIKITLQNIPLVIVAFLYGPVEGALVGGMGMLLNQILGPFGITATTALWILPHTICGAYLGFMSKKINYNEFFKVALLIVSALLILTVLNTAVIYIDSKVYGYYSKAYVFGTLIIRILAAIVNGIIYSLIIPKICERISRKGN